jgi:hypothetical protein
VTKIAPEDRVADYMGVHTFFTGIRGILAPLTAFQLAQSLPMTHLGIFSALLIFLATAMLIPEIRTSRKESAPQPLAEEVTK